MRRLLLALVVVLLPSFAIAHGHGGGHGGMGGTGGGRMAGGWSAHAASIARFGRRGEGRPKLSLSRGQVVRQSVVFFLMV